MANEKESSKPWWWQQWEWFCHDQHVQLSQCSYVAFCNKSHTSFRCIKHYYTSRDHQTLHTSPTFRVSKDLQQNPNDWNSWSLYRNKRPLQKSAHCVCHKLKTQVKPFQQRNGKTEEEEDSSSVIPLIFYMNQNRKTKQKEAELLTSEGKWPLISSTKRTTTLSSCIHWCMLFPHARMNDPEC